MRSTTRLENFKKRQKRLLKTAQIFNTMSLTELQLLRVELIKTLHNLNTWLALLNHEQQQSSPENQRFLKVFRDQANRLEMEVASLILEKEQEHSLHQEWEADLLPEPSTDRITPKYPALASHISPDLISLMDDSWLPVDRPSDVRPLSMGAAQ